jgi:hypothetical protein
MVPFPIEKLNQRTTIFSLRLERCSPPWNTPCVSVCLTRRKRGRSQQANRAALGLTQILEAVSHHAKQSTKSACYSLGDISWIGAGFGKGVAQDVDIARHRLSLRYNLKVRIIDGKAEVHVFACDMELYSLTGCKGVGRNCPGPLFSNGFRFLDRRHALGGNCADIGKFAQRLIICDDYNKDGDRTKPRPQTVGSRRCKPGICRRHAGSNGHPDE